MKNYVMTFEQFLTESKKQNEEVETGQVVNAPDVLYHACKPEDVEKVKKEGLLPIEEKVVFLAKTEEGARLAIKEEEGRADSVILKIDAKKMAEDGITFDGGLKVDWFAVPKVEAKYIS